MYTNFLSPVKDCPIFQLSLPWKQRHVIIWRTQLIISLRKYYYYFYYYCYYYYYYYYYY